MNTPLCLFVGRHCRVVAFASAFWRPIEAHICIYIQKKSKNGTDNVKHPAIMRSIVDTNCHFIHTLRGHERSSNWQSDNLIGQILAFDILRLTSLWSRLQDCGERQRTSEHAHVCRLRSSTDCEYDSNADCTVSVNLIHIFMLSFACTCTCHIWPECGIYVSVQHKTSSHSGNNPNKLLTQYGKQANPINQVIPLNYSIHTNKRTQKDT